MNTKKLTLALSIAAAAAAIAVGGAVAFASVPGASPAAVGTQGSTQVAPPWAKSGDGKIAWDCVQAGHLADPAGWRPGARIDVDVNSGFLVIRNDKSAAVCVIEGGKGTGIMGGDVSTTHVYGNLTATRPFDYLTSMNYEHDSVHFGIASKDVTAVSLVGPDKSVTAATLKDGTFIARVKAGEDSTESTTNHVRATLDNGKVVEGPFRQ